MRLRDSTSPLIVASWFGKPREMGGLVGSLGVRAEPSLYPEAKHILYQVLIRNASSQPMINARVVPRIIKGSLMIRDAPKIIPKLNGNSSGTATFILEPTDEVEIVEIEGFITFLRDKNNSSIQLLLPLVSFDFTLPPLINIQVSEEEWRDKVSKYFSDEKAFISLQPPDKTLEICTTSLQEMGLAYITRYKAEEGFVMERRDFFGIDKKGHGYATRILWRFPLTKHTKQNLLVRVFAETEEGLFAFCHRILLRLEKLLNPKDAET